MERKLVAVISILLLASYYANAQQGVSKVGTTAAAFLEIPVGARALGMGNAYVASALDVSGIYWNPAGIARISSGQILVQHSNWLAGTTFDYAAVAIPLGDLGTVGTSVTAFNSGDMQVRNENFPDGTGIYFNASDVAISVSYARPLTDRFSIGFNAKYIQQSIWHESAAGFAIDIGTIFQTDFLGGLRIGASIYNFGTDLQMAGADLRQFHPIDPTKLGTNQNIPEDIETAKWPLPLNFQFGVATEAVKTASNRLTIALDAQYPSDNFESLNFGFEYSYQEFFFIRAGYQSLFLKDGEGGASAGIGLQREIPYTNLTVAFDYSYNDFGRLSATHTFTLRLNF